MSATRRQLKLLGLLENEEYISVKAIKRSYKMEGLKYSKSQFYRDIDFLKTLGYCIENDKSGNFNLNKELSDNYDFLSHYYKHLAMSHLCESATKLNKDFLKFIVFEKNSTFHNFPLFKIVFNAICNKNSIEFKHTSFYFPDKVETYKLRPFLLKEYKNRWYVVGETNKGFRTFGLDRLSDLMVLDEAVSSKFEKAISMFDHTVGLNFSDHEPCIIKLSFHKSQEPYLKSLPIHYSQKIFPTIEARFELTLFLSYNFELKQELLKYGHFVKVISPHWIKDDFKLELENALKMYD
jgi:predicted DNA-binding transcriptional regulator YafY